MAMGTRFMIFSNQPVTPNKVISSAQAMNAPIASAMEKPPANPAVANTAAPGVDHATITGLRSHSEGTSEHRPMPMPSAHIQDATSDGLASNASAA